MDSLLAKKEAPVPDVIKLDVEGAEHQVLEGGRNFFSGPSARLLIETHGLEVS
ncbi:MAG: FkbM family methyltransferase, partial [Chthoniobacterales bacterium]